MNAFAMHSGIGALTRLEIAWLLSLRISRIIEDEMKAGGWQESSYTLTLNFSDSLRACGPATLSSIIGLLSEDY